jgi:glucose-6-phosphate-specific signal transduction histidine kinase
MNLISNDLNMIEDKIHYLPKMFVVPFYMLGVNILIILRYGWQGAIGAVLILVIAMLGYA